MSYYLKKHKTVEKTQPLLLLFFLFVAILASILYSPNSAAFSELSVYSLASATSQGAFLFYFDISVLATLWHIIIFRALSAYSKAAGAAFVLVLFFPLTFGILLYLRFGLHGAGEQQSQVDDEKNHRMPSNRNPVLSNSNNNNNNLPSEPAFLQNSSAAIF